MNLRGSSPANLCRHAIEASWLAAVVAGPLFLSPLSFRETDKAVLTSALAAVGAIAWGLKSFLERRTPPASAPAASPVAWWRRPFHLPLLLLAAGYVASTGFAIAPRVSFWGSYERGQGLIALCGYLTLF